MTTQAISSSIDEQAISLAYAGAPPLSLPALPRTVPGEARGLPVETVPVDPHRQNNFDFLRFLLAGLVIYSHSFLLCLGRSASSRSEPFSLLTGGQASGGDLAVDAFFAISGFLIVQSWLRSESAWLYLQKRVARIYPGFIASALFCLFLVCALSSPGTRHLLCPTAFGHYMASTLALHSINLPGAFSQNPAPGANGSTWTILPEFFCYLVVALLGWRGTYRRPSILLALTFVFIGLFGVQQELHPGLMDDQGPTSWLPVVYEGPWPRLLSFFLAGMCFHFHRERLRYSRPTVAAAAALLAASVLLKHGIWLVLPTCGVYLLFGLAFIAHRPLNSFGRRGDFSYGLYLYGCPVQQTLVALWRPYLTPHSLFFLALPASCVLAFASWHWVEKPFLQRKPR